MKRTLLCLGLALAAFVSARGAETALDRYVAKADPAFRWELAGTIPGEGVSGYVLDVTSQNWLTPAEVDRTTWKHWVTVYKPARVTSDIALLMIVGGNNESKPPEKLDPFLRLVAEKTGTVTVELRMVPNQPLSFFGESRRRNEDAIIAFNWKKFLETGDERWPTRLPMTKSAVRAMDAAQAFLASQAGGGARVARWVVMGGSKRGWTTWTTGAVDKRVIAIVPAVIDLLNMDESFTHHWRAYGFWAPAVGDYVEHGVMEWRGSRQWRDLMKMVEPYEYRDRLTMPKFIVNSTGDQFFLPDSSQFYFKDLKGEKYLRYVPNTDHGVTRKSDAGESILTYYHSIVAGWKRPEFSWIIGKDGSIAVECKDKPAAVKLWQANNPTARDFRLEKIGPAYRATDLEAAGPGRYFVKLAKPQQGYTASFLELTFRSPGGSDWKFTTDVKVMPDTYPYPPPVMKLPPGATPLKAGEK